MIHTKVFVRIRRLLPLCRIPATRHCNCGALFGSNGVQQWPSTGGRRNIATKWMRPGPGIWKSGKFEIQKITKIQNLEIKIRSAQNVGKVWISRKKQLPAPFGAIWGNFSMGRKKCRNFAYFPWWANGPYSPGLGKWLQYFFCHPYLVYHVFN